MTWTYSCLTKICDTDLTFIGWVFSQTIHFLLCFHPHSLDKYGDLCANFVVVRSLAITYSTRKFAWFQIEKFNLEPWVTFIFSEVHNVTQLMLLPSNQPQASLQYLLADDPAIYVWKKHSYIQYQVLNSSSIFHNSNTCIVLQEYFPLKRNKFYLYMLVWNITSLILFYCFIIRITLIMTGSVEVQLSNTCLADACKRKVNCRCL